ncbi:MAG: tryptophan-rich sensory protein [Clostridia bacterium]|nr:tryptophan-rich sensory protein [Clostridia bacterium]
MERKRDIWPYVVFILLSLLTGGLATLVSMDGMKAFQYLPQSPLTPPPVVFSVVWSILYILMGVSAALVYTASPRGLKDQHLLYAGTLLLNFLWPVLFFALELRLAALVTLLVMLALAIGTVVRYRPVRPLAAWLQLPYTLWLCFAFYLNLTAYQLNG